MSEPVTNACLVLLRALLAEERWWDGMNLIKLFKSQSGPEFAVVEKYFHDHFNNTLLVDALEALEGYTPVCLALRKDPRVHEQQVISFYIDVNGLLDRVDLKKHSYHERGFFAEPSQKLLRSTDANSFLGRAAFFIGEHLNIPYRHGARKGAPVSNFQ